MNKRLQQRAAFEEDLRKDPYNQETRLVYADWLEEEGYPDEALTQREWTIDKQLAEDYLRGVAKKCGISYERLLYESNGYLDSEGHWDLDNTNPTKVVESMRQYWINFRTVTGRDYDYRYREPSEDEDEYRCAC